MIQQPQGGLKSAFQHFSHNHSLENRLRHPWVRFAIFDFRAPPSRPTTNGNDIPLAKPPSRRRAKAAMATARTPRTATADGVRQLSRGDAEAQRTARRERQRPDTIKTRSAAASLPSRRSPRLRASARQLAVCRLSFVVCRPWRSRRRHSGLGASATLRLGEIRRSRSRCRYCRLPTEDFRMPSNSIRSLQQIQSKNSSPNWSNIGRNSPFRTERLPTPSLTSAIQHATVYGL